MKWNLPKGDQFLPNVSIDELKALHKVEKDTKARDRLLVYMARKRSEPIRKIADDFSSTYSTIRDWLVRARDGLDRLHDVKRLEPSRRLNNAQLAGIREDLLAGPRKFGFETDMWTGKILVEHIKRKHGIVFVPRTMQTLMHKMGFRHIKPRPRHPKAASDEEKKELKKAAQIATYSNLGYKILADNESSNILGWNVQKGWYHKDAKATSSTTLSNKRFYSMRLLGNGTLYCRFYDKANTENYMDFLRYACREYSKIVIFTDNASIHKSKALLKFLDEMDDKIKIYFPPYTPELNPIEQQWRMHKMATGNRIYADVKEMQESICTMHERNEIPVVKMSEYLNR